MRNLLIDYILEHGQGTSRWPLMSLSDEALLQKYNEVRDVINSLLAL